MQAVAFQGQGAPTQGGAFQNYTSAQSGNAYATGQMGGQYATGYAAGGEYATGYGYGSGYPAGAAPSISTIAATAPYGASINAQLNANASTATGYGAQYAGSQYGQGANVQTIVGAPIYVPQPYQAPYPVPLPPGSPCCRGGAGGAVFGGGAMPFGIEIFAGREFSGDGELFTKKSSGPPDGDYSIGTRVGSIKNISYGDAFGTASTIGGALSYDVGHSTTVFGAVSHAKAEGQTVENYTTVQPGTWTNQVFTPDAGSSPRGLDGTFTDLETTTIEAGVRQYTDSAYGMRAYLGGSAGFSHNNEVTFTQTYNDDKSYYGERTFINSGWTPTAAVTFGAELPVGPRAAVSVESGLRWRDNMDTASESEDRLTIPLTLRGRLAF
jgi:hypothetical protein